MHVWQSPRSSGPGRTPLPSGRRPGPCPRAAAPALARRPAGAAVRAWVVFPRLRSSPGPARLNAISPVSRHSGRWQRYSRLAIPADRRSPARACRDSTLLRMLDDYQPEGTAETADVARTRALTESAAQPVAPVPAAALHRVRPGRASAQRPGAAALAPPAAGLAAGRWARRPRRDRPARHRPARGPRRRPACPTSSPGPTRAYARSRWSRPRARRRARPPARRPALPAGHRPPDAVVPEAPDAPLRWLSVAEAAPSRPRPNLLECWPGPGGRWPGTAEPVPASHTWASHTRLVQSGAVLTP